MVGYVGLKPPSTKYENNVGGIVRLQNGVGKPRLSILLVAKNTWLSGPGITECWMPQIFELK